MDAQYILEENMKNQRFDEFNLLPYEIETQIIEDGLINQNKLLLGAAGGYASDYASTIEESDFNFEFDPTVSKADKLDYQVAAASGVLAALINELFVGEFSLHDSHNWGQDKVEKLIFRQAKKDGYQGSDLKQAIAKLEQQHKMATDSLTSELGGALQHHLRDFTHHFSLTGLTFSIITQFTKKGYGTDTLGKFVSYDLPNTVFIGKSFAEKMYFGTVKWLLHLLSDVAGSSGAIGKGTGIPGPILSFLKTTSSMPIFKNLKLKYNEDSLSFSQYVSKFYNGTHYILNKDGERIPFDLRTEMGIANHIGKSAVPVIANEVIVRSFYTIRRIIEIIDEHGIENFEDFLMVDSKSYLPINNRRLNRMMTVSSGMFVTLTTLSVTAKGMIKRGPSNALPYILVNTNYIGVFRFGVAIKADFEYIKEDIKEFKQYYLNRQLTVYDNVDLTMINELFTLDYEKERILDSIKFHMIRYDIISEKDENKKAFKEAWFMKWQEGYFEEKLMQHDNYILKTSIELYQAYNEEIDDDSNRWITLVYLDLNSFNPYHPLDEDIKKYSKLKMTSDYLSDVFIPQQNVMTEDQLKEIDKEIKKSFNHIKGTNQKMLLGTGGIVTLSVLTGGVALAFAPKIAVVLAGTSVAGLSGAALTSASLALVGGGSLAVGGLGMAGGTAIIMGGGTLLGASLGTASLFATIGSVSSEYALQESTKLLTYIKIEIVNLDDSHIYLTNIYKTILRQVSELDVLSLEKEDKKELKNIKESIKYLDKCAKEVFKLIQANIDNDQIILLENNGF